MPLTTFPVSYSRVQNVYANAARIGSVTAIDSATVAMFLGKAEIVVNAHIAGLYTLPFTVEVPVLQHISEEIGTYFILRRLFTEQIGANKGLWMDRFKEAEKLLITVSDGESPLYDSTGNLITPQVTVWGSTDTYVPTFSELPPEYWFIDWTKQQAELLDRQLGAIWLRGRLL